VALSFSASSDATNLVSSSYTSSSVNPSEFNSEDEDFEFEIPFSNPVVSSSLHLTFKHLLILIFSSYILEPDV
jgi:hypothetical protein